MHFLLSNFNLLHSNSNWNLIKRKFNVKIDENFNNFFLSLNNRKIINKFETFHIIINTDKSNKNELLKKFRDFRKVSKNFNDKIFFFYVTNEHNNNKNAKKINLNLLRILNLKEVSNIFIKFYNNSDNISHNLRNKKFLKFPYDVSSINVFNKLISSNIKIYNSKPYKLIIVDCDNTLWGVF